MKKIMMTESPYDMKDLMSISDQILADPDTEFTVQGLGTQLASILHDSAGLYKVAGTIPGDKYVELVRKLVLKANAPGRDIEALLDNDEFMSSVSKVFVFKYGMSKDDIIKHMHSIDEATFDLLISIVSKEQ